MLQNAEDAAKDANLKKAKVLLQLNSNRLIIANDGEPFSKEGVNSLFFSNNTSKTKKRYIGQKGLGFRSLLNWSNHVRIQSGDFFLEYSRNNAIKKLQEIIDEPAIKEIIEKISDEKYPIATLVAPNWLTNSLNDQHEEYDTFIEVDYSQTDDREKIKEDIEEQIESIKGEELLFLKHIHKIKVITNDREEKIIKKYLKRSKKFVIEKYANCQLLSKKKWDIFSTEGDMPTKEIDALGKTIDKEMFYQLSVAVPENLSEKYPLYCFFKTKETTGLPVILHGTFELRASRDYLLPHNSNNKELTNKLAKFLIKVALSYRSPKGPWRAINVLLSLIEESNNLNEYGFYDLVIESLKEAPIFPAINGSFISIQDALWINKPLSGLIKDYVRLNVLPNLIVYTDDKHIHELIKSKLDKEITKEDKKEIIDNLSKIPTKLGMADLADLIIFCQDNSQLFNIGSYSTNIVMPSLILNHDGIVCNGNSEEKVYIGSIDLDPPEGLSINFINRELQTQLTKKLDIDNPEELVDRLSHYKNLELINGKKLYEETIDGLNDEANGNPGVISEKYKSLLFWCFKNSELIEPNEVNFEVQLPNKNNEYLSASRLYFGKGYETGERNEDLLIGVEEEIFITDVKTLGLENHPKKEVFDFLKEIKVNDSPKEIITILHSNSIEESFLYSYLEQVSFPAKFSMSHGPVQIEASKDLFNDQRRSIKATIFQYLEEILKSAPTHRILEWLSEHRDLLLEDKKLSVTFWIRSEYREIINAPKFSYFRWKICSTPWIEIVRKDGSSDKVAPQDCMFDDQKNAAWKPWVRLLSLSKLIESFQSKHSKKQWRKNDLKRLLWDSGVRETISDFFQEQMVKFLLMAEEIGARRSYVEKLYRHIGESFLGGGKSIISRLWNDYHESGKILLKGQLNEFRFNVCNKTYYSGDQIYPVQAYPYYPLAAIPKTLTNAISEEIFGLNQLPKKQILQICNNRRIIKHDLEDEFDKILKNCKLYLYAFRVQKSEQKDEEKNLLKLKELKITLCSKVGLILSIEQDVEVSIFLEDNEFFKKDKSNEYLLVISNKIKTKENLMDEDAFVRSIDDILSDLWSSSEHGANYIRILESSSNSKRESIVINSVGIDALDESKKWLAGAKSDFYNFWNAVFKAKNKPIKDVRDSEIENLVSVNFPKAIAHFKKMNKADYANLDDVTTLFKINELFQALSLTVSAFNRNADEMISASDYNRREIRLIHNNVRILYEKYIYKRLIDKGINERQKFISIVSQQEKLFGVESTTKAKEFIDCTRFYFDRFNLLTNQSLTMNDLDKFSEIDIPNYEDLYNEFGKKINKEELEVLLDFFENKSNGSLLFYKDTWNVLLKRFDAYFKNHKEKSKKSDYSADDSKISKKAKLVTPDFKIKKRKSTNPPRGHTKRIFGSTKKRKEKEDEIGLEGERAVFNMLKDYSKEVKWVSEFARLDGNNINGRDGLGYDITYKASEGITKFLEVKSSTSRITSFDISDNEYQTARDYGTDFQIALVRLYNDREAEISILENIFTNEKSYKKEPSSYFVEILPEAEKLEVKLKKLKSK